MLLYVPVLLVLAMLSQALPKPFGNYLEIYVGASGESTAFLMLVATVLSLGFFIASAFRRNPRWQYLLEFILALALCVAMSSVTY